MEFIFESFDLLLNKRKDGTLDNILVNTLLW